MFKRCSTCKEEKPITEFRKNSYKRDGLQSNCRSCKKVLDKEYYKVHRATQRSQIMAARRRRVGVIKLKILAYQKEHPCIDCGETDPIVLDFDHVRGTKITNIARMVNDETPWTIIEKEIEKCDVRCANCHRRATHFRRMGR